MSFDKPLRQSQGERVAVGIIAIHLVPAPLWEKVRKGDMTNDAQP